MSDVDLKEVICTRLLTIDGAGTATVSIGKPSKCDENGRDYCCSYVISGAGLRRRGRAFGIDGVQAIIMAMLKIGTDLYTSDVWKQGKLSWEGENKKGDLGFPVPDTIKDIPPSMPY